jgi:hypothetical protein
MVAPYNFESISTNDETLSYCFSLYRKMSLVKKLQNAECIFDNSSDLIFDTGAMEFFLFILFVILENKL